MNGAIALAFLVTAIGYIVSLQFWAFYTAPWIRERGHHSANWKVWFFGFPETWDLGKAVRIAVKEEKRIPIPLLCHLIFQGIQYAGLLAMIALSALGKQMK